MIPFKSRTEEGAPKKKSHGCLITILVFCVLYFGAMVWLGYTMSDTSVHITDNSVYHLELNGVLSDQAPEENPFADLLRDTPYGNTPYGNSVEQVGLEQILSNIELAKQDNRIRGIWLDGGSLSMPPASAQEIRRALLDFKQSGKWIVAYAANWSGPTNYYISSVADRIYMNPTGAVSWNGLGGTKMYYTRLLEKIGVEMQILKVGTFKSAVEPYFRTSMSEADRAQTLRYLTGIWDELKAGVSESRGIPTDSLDAFADRVMALQPAEEAVRCGLVDTLVYSQTMDEVLTELCGGEKPTKINTADLWKVERKTTPSKNTIAVVYAEGDITDEKGDGIVGKEMLKTLKKVGKEESVKAVVLRVNSPGGSADASEQIWHAVRLLQEQGLPVVVSMGGYAASGGYYISSEADYIFAEPTTLTGSIGIFGMIPNFGALREKVGLDIDYVGTNRHSDMESGLVIRGMSAEEQAMMQAMIERGYDLFTRRCAEGRHMSQDDIKKIAEGRVWLGKDALEIGLVDELGGLDLAIAKAAELAQLSDYETRVWPEKEDFLTQLLKSMDNTTEEEKLVMKIRELCRQPRIMARMEDIIIR